MTVTTFAPTALTNFTFQATLDGALYNVVITWNIYRAGDAGANGWYFNVYDQSRTLVLAIPLVGSPPVPEPGINLVGGFFTTSTVYFYPVSQTFIVSP